MVFYSIEYNYLLQSVWIIKKLKNNTLEKYLSEIKNRCASLTSRLVQIFYSHTLIIKTIISHRGLGMIPRIRNKCAASVDGLTQQYLSTGLTHRCSQFKLQKRTELSFVINGSI